jgi:hypothetical protein
LLLASVPFNGEPTGISHLCPGFPCSGFKLPVIAKLFSVEESGEVDVAGFPVAATSEGNGVEATGSEAETGRGSPSAISQR